MPLEILEKPICYSTFQTQKEASEKLLRCSRCRCAWYKSREDQRSNWHVHKEVCKRPEYERISEMTVPQCMEVLKQQGTQTNHNTAAMFERIFDLVRNGSDSNLNSVDGESLTELGYHLHAFSRLQLPGMYNMKDTDCLDWFYQRAWACPGMPQLLYFTDLTSTSYRQMMKDYPEGHPIFDDEDKECNFNMKYDNDGDLTGEYVSWFIVGFLVRSCVWGDLALSSNHDGRGNLRNTIYANAAMIRLAKIFSSKMMRNSAKKALYPVVGLMLNVAENKQKEFIDLLDLGAAVGIMEWADQDYGKGALEIMTRLDMSKLSEHHKLDILEICLNIYGKHPVLPWSSFLDNKKDSQLINICMRLILNLFKTCSDLKGLLETGLKRRPELLSRQWDEKTGRVRIPIAFIFEKFTAGHNLLQKIVLKNLLEEWGKLEVWDKMKYAEKVLEVEELRYFETTAEEVKKIHESYKKMKKNKRK